MYMQFKEKISVLGLRIPVTVIQRRSVGAYGDTIKVTS